MKVTSILGDIFLRKYFFQTNIFSGTTYWDEILQALKDIIMKNEILNGPDISAYENYFAKTIDAKACFSFSAGRMALYAILKALGIGRGDEVIIPAFTCVVVPNAIIYTGAKPVYCDIETERFGPDPESVKSKITPQTKAIIAQHTFGIPCYIDEIMNIANHFGIPVIEDCAHSLGATYKGKSLGSIGYASFFSTDHTKIISTSIGGVAATNDHDCINKLKEIYNKSDFLSSGQIRRQVLSFALFHILSHPRLYWIGKYVLSSLIKARILMYITDYLSLIKPQRYPFPARLSNVHARIGISQLKHLSENISYRKKIAQKFEGILSANEKIFKNKDMKCAWLRYPFLVENRDEFTNAFQKYHSLGIWFTHITQCRRGNFHEIGYENGSCPRAEWTTKRIVSIPTHFRMVHLANLISEISKLERISNRLYYYKK